MARVKANFVRLLEDLPKLTNVHEKIIQADPAFMPGDRILLVSDYRDDLEEDAEAVEQKRAEQDIQRRNRELDDILRGTMYACLSVTDDKPYTLEKLGSANPWHIQALKMITGSEDEAYRPLSEILLDHTDLEIDCHLNFSKVKYSPHALGAQGYIAHNDEIIVLSYSCKTSAFDWMPYMQTTSSEWKPKVSNDDHGISYYVKQAERLLGVQHNPRVHATFYENFMASQPQIKSIIGPMLGANQPPRKVFVTGYSLGGGIATLATLYLLLELDWNVMAQSLCSVTAGSPRVCGDWMATLAKERLDLFPQKVNLYRLVRGNDVVTNVPPTTYGYRHITTATALHDDGYIQIPWYLEEDRDDTLEKCISQSPKGTSNSDGREAATSLYEQMVNRSPTHLRDHMPDFYLRPLLLARGIPIPAPVDLTRLAVHEEKRQRKIKKTHPRGMMVHNRRTYKAPRRRRDDESAVSDGASVTSLLYLLHQKF